MLPCISQDWKLTVPPLMMTPPPCQIWKVITIGQFREVSSIGAFEESSGKVPQMGAHPVHCCVAVDIAGLEVDRAATDSNSAALRNEKGARNRSVQGTFFDGGVRRKFSESAAHILMTSSNEFRQCENRSSDGQFSELSSMGAFEESSRKVQRTAAA